MSHFGNISTEVLKQHCLSQNCPEFDLLFNRLINTRNDLYGESNNYSSPEKIVFTGKRVKLSDSVSLSPSIALSSVTTILEPKKTGCKELDALKYKLFLVSQQIRTIETSFIPSQHTHFAKNSNLKRDQEGESNFTSNFDSLLPIPLVSSQDEEMINKALEEENKINFEAQKEIDYLVSGYNYTTNTLNSDHLMDINQIRQSACDFAHRIILYTKKINQSNHDDKLIKYLIKDLEELAWSFATTI